MLLQYMDRIYVKHQNKAPVAQLGLDLWRDHVVRQAGIRDRMLAMLLELMHRERTGDIVDRALLRSITMVSDAICLLPLFIRVNSAARFAILPAAAQDCRACSRGVRFELQGQRHAVIAEV